MNELIGGALTALIVLAGQIIMYRMTRRDAKADAAALLESSKRIEKKVDGFATAREERIDQKQATIDSQSEQLHVADKLQVLTEQVAESDVATALRTTPPKVP